MPTVAMILTAVLQYGPTVVPLIAKLVGDVQAGRGNKEVTPEDIAELVRLSSQSSSDIYAKLGIAPPPAKP